MVKGYKATIEQPEKNFILFLARSLFISMCCIALIIPIINIIFLDYFWDSKEDKEFVEKKIFKD